MREALFEIYTWILCLSYLHEKQTSRIQSLYLYFIKIVPFWLRNIRFLIQNTRSLFYGGHYSSLHQLMSLHRIKVLKVLLAGLICRYIMVGRRGSRFFGLEGAKFGEVLSQIQGGTWWGTRVRRSPEAPTI